MSQSLERKVALSTLLAEQVGLDNIARNSKWGQLIKSQGVPRSRDFRRIERLPTRDWRTDSTLAAVTQELTQALLLPGGERPCGPHCTCPRELWPNQAAALIEAGTVNGVFGPIAVGNGKALISLLVAVVMGAKRPLLFVPAQLRDQTLRRVLPATRRHWRTHPHLRVHGYSELSIAKNKNMLQRLSPDLIILDEAHNVKNPSAARTRRLKDYLKDNPLTKVVALSGTMCRRSLRDYWQLLHWTHKPDMMPMPAAWSEMTCWADALDVGVDDERRQEPGALMCFCSGNEGPREGYQRRLTSTPGVIASSARELGVSLVISAEHVQVPNKVLGMMAHMRASWETPYGDMITEPVELWRHMRELACGMFYRWEPLPPADWLEARKNWRKFVRETLKHNRRGLDSELLVARECAELQKTGKAPDAWTTWREIRESFEINTIPEWVDDFALTAATKWLKGSVDTDYPNGGIVWTEQVAFAERLAQVSGFPYFGAGMKASAAIGDAKGPIIASLSAHGEGKNLQAWGRNLITSPPSSGKTWEQCMGRTHRQGQLADEVTVDVWLHAQELFASLRQAIAEARFLEQTLGTRQKLCYATVNVEGL